MTGLVGRAEHAAGRPALSQHAIPLAETADLGRLARRTTIVRVVLLRGDPRGDRALRLRELDRLHVGEATLLGPGSSGVVVLDLSSSTDSAPPREIPGVLRHLANAGGRSGLVLFSDVAYEALPLGATSEELRPFLRYFRRPALPPQPVAGANGRFTRPPRIIRRATPWSRSFRSGTRISAGLESARRMVLEEPSRGKRRPARQRPQRLAVRRRRARADAATLQARRDPPPDRGAPPDGREPRLLREQGRARARSSSGPRSPTGSRAQSGRPLAGGDAVGADRPDLAPRRRARRERASLRTPRVEDGMRARVAAAAGGGAAARGGAARRARAPGRRVARRHAQRRRPLRHRARRPGAVGGAGRPGRAASPETCSA